ncbi:TetR/AcrR family transcriptional regulator [Actinoplanes sp. G11-F43]|uniref:TetR/AcrR family transcriptional regulator n=1 Tax=Actinoplanes sp. G11-F43 TaxID=3424130 RepID=UPI003D34B405
MAGRRRDPEAHRAALTAAEELLTEVGYHRVTMERIAERSGVAKMTLYRWWPNKAAVVTDAVRDRLAPVDVTGDAVTVLGLLVGALTRYGDAGVVAAAMSSRGEAGRADLRDILHPWEEALRAVTDPVTARAWLGYVVYRVVFLLEEITEQELQTLVDRTSAAHRSDPNHK